MSVVEHGGDADPLVLPPNHMLRAFDAVNVCAPMVRYSKLPFRALVAQYDTHITTTPMILASEFSHNQMARDADFSTNAEERGTFRLAPAAGGTRGPVAVRGALVCQLAASSAAPLADAAELVSPYVDGIDLNCGCPQSWAYSERIGSYLLRQPETVHDMVKTCKARLGDGFCVSVKIRVDSDPARTDALVRNALHAGASLISIHGRTRHQASASHPVDLDAVRFAVEAANACGLHTALGTSPGDAWVVGEDGGAGGPVPCVVNGDIWTREDACVWRAKTGARGAMSARGLLANPALFAGYERTPKAAVQQFTDRAIMWGLHPSLMHRHLAYMLEACIPSRAETVYFNSLASGASILDWLTESGYGRG
ncbi:tRNA-dihydrouridine(20a/20b) synthase [NAD(P)(+)] [Malassezia sp. CBS 17886]|nr:tRNA-dihydrouridine(20a/20b) synthase [NAD(P)(+)] [Malassezia sp. CBS 17886]